MSAIARWAPYALPVLVSPWIPRLAAAYRDAPVFRDVGLYRLTGWCLRHGLRLYSDVITPDGPFIHFVNAVIGALTDDSEKSFRTVDLVVHTVVAGVIGLLIAPSGRLRWGVALATLAACHVLSLDYFEGGQRELYYASFGHLGMALLFAGSQWRWRAGRIALVLGGALVGMQLLGKPSGLVFAALGGLSVALSENTSVPRSRRLMAASAGIVPGALGLLGATAAFGSLSGFFTWYFEYPFRIYRFYAWHGIGEMLALTRWTDLASAAFSAIVGGGAIWVGLLPRAALGFALLPLAHLFVAVLQRKGWSYHFLPVGFATDVVAVMLVLAAWAVAMEGARSKLNPRVRIPLAWSALTLLAARSFAFVIASPLRADAPYSSEYATQTAAFSLRATTSPDDRVFYVGEDANVLLLARRLPASPYLMTFFLDFSFAPQSAGADRGRIEAFQRRVQADACPRLANRPKAIVIGPSLGMNAAQALERVCPVEAAEVPAYYSLREDAGNVRIYVRKP